MKFPLWLDGHWEASTEHRTIHSPWDGKEVSIVDYATAEQMQKALNAAETSFKIFSKSSRAIRSELLKKIAATLSTKRKSFAEAIVAEAGKPLNLAETEVQRAISTFTIAAEESKRYGGEAIPMDLDAASRGMFPALSLWVPRGPILGITPFNFPLNLVAHKVAPALAVGASIILKPAPQAPRAALLLAQAFEEAAKELDPKHEQIPLAALQVVSCTNDVAELAVKDARIATLSFTGSAAVGWALQEKAKGKKIALELGGNAAVIVHSDSNWEKAATRCAFGSFAYAGQVCISIQRIYVERSIQEKFVHRFLEETKKTISGDPTQSGVIVGPLIDSKARERILSWVEQAKKRGAKLLAGGQGSGNVLEPIVLTAVPEDLPLVCEEVFGPVVIVEPYDTWDQALEKVNHSKYGLQAGIYTESWKRISSAFEQLDVGAVLVNEIPTYRADHMPYGGMKGSGLGREGLKYAMEDYSERKTLVLAKV